MTAQWLNKLTFTWKLPYNPEAGLSGIWWFSTLDHPHAQWTKIAIQSNSVWFGPWGIQQLLTEWRVRCYQMAGPLVTVDPVTGIVLARDFSLNPKVHYMADAEKQMTNKELKPYREALDQMISATYRDMSTYLEASRSVRNEPSHTVADHLFLEQFENAFA